MTVQYQLARPGAKLAPQTLEVNSTGKGVGLLVRPIGGAAPQAVLHEGEEDPPAGWVGWSLHQALKEPATLVQYSQSGRLPLAMATLLLPYRGEQAPRLTAKRLEVSDAAGAVPAERGMALEIAGDGWRDLCYLSHDPVRRPVRFGGLETDAEVAVARVGADGHPKTLCLLEGTVLKASGPGTMAPAATPREQAVNVVENRVSVAVEQAAKLALRYGYAAGGGFLFETRPTAPATSATFRLHGPKLELPYLYEVVAYGSSGARVVQRGTITVPEPHAFTFDGGALEGWSGTGVRLVAGYRGTPGALRVQDAATADVRYIGIDRPAKLLLTPEFKVALAFRSPMAEGGQYFYTKVTLRTDDGDDWSAYFSTAPVPDWQELSLALKDFRGDTNQGANLGKSLAPGRRVSRVLITLRKDKTAQPVAPCFEVDDIKLGE